MNTGVFSFAVLCMGFLAGIYAGLGLGMNPAVEVLAGLTVQLGAAMWVGSQIRRRRYQAAFDAETFVFFLWPVAGPYYLFRTRGWRAVYILLLVGALWVTGGVAGVFVGMSI